MKRITREMCLVFLKDYYYSILVFHSILSVFFLAALWIFTKRPIAVLIAGILLVTLCVLHGIHINSKIRHLQLTGLYLVEDVVIDFDKRVKLRRSGADKCYTFSFKNHGKHSFSISITPAFEIHFHKDTSITASAIHRLAIQSCNIGDRFYLLICEDGRKKRIIQIFDKQHFNIQRREFQLLDEKYYVKTDLPD